MLLCLFVCLFFSVLLQILFTWVEIYILHILFTVISLLVLSLSALVFSYVSVSAVVLMEFLTFCVLLLLVISIGFLTMAFRFFLLLTIFVVKYVLTSFQSSSNNKNHFVFLRINYLGKKTRSNAHCEWQKCIFKVLPLLTVFAFFLSVEKKVHFKIKTTQNWFG